MIASNSNIEKKLILLAIVLFPFQFTVLNLPIVGKNIVNLCYLLGIVIFIYRVIIGTCELDNFEKFSTFYLFVLFLWKCVCTGIGVYEFSAYHLINLEQMDKLRYLLQNLRSIGFVVSEITAMKLWIFLLLIRNCLLDVVFSYGVTVLVYHAFKYCTEIRETEEPVFSQMTLSINVLCVILIVYSVFETGYLRGNYFCRDLLTKINPFIYKVQASADWWPPLLWNNQLRSLFAEPSYLGLASAFITPFLFYKL